MVTRLRRMELADKVAVIGSIKRAEMELNEAAAHVEDVDANLAALALRAASARIDEAYKRLTESSQ